jgi:micrococcal nuclease
MMMFLMIGKRETKSNMELFQYKAEVIRVVDGDTIDASVDLGFDTWKKVRIRFQGFNAPESRTRDLEEKKRGLAAKDRVIEILKENDNKFLLKSHGVGKYGRCLGEIFVETLGDDSLQKTLINEGHGVEYNGGKR